MAANYWIKLYIEILNDSKMAVLPDRLWRRAIECFLAAGLYGNGGQLPDTQQLAWLFRMATDDLELDLKQIAMTGMLQRNAEGWLVTKFAIRQAPTPANERQRQHRDREKKQQYYGDVTDLSRNVTQINRLTDNRLTDTESETPPPPLSFVSPDKILCDASGLVTFPANQVQWINTVQEMVHEYGVERTTAAMKAACTKWITTRGQNGQTYRKTNLNWIAWAQEELAATPPDYSGEVDMSKMNQAELDAYIKVKYADELEGA